MEMRALLVICFVVLSLLVQGVVGLASNNGLVVVVTIPSLVGDIEEIVCEGDSVLSIVPPGVDPHSYQLTAKDYELLSRADVIVSLGHTPFEVSIRRLVEEGRISAVLVELPRIPGIRLRVNPATGYFNLHLPVYDPGNYVVFVEYLARVMGELNPSCSSVYRENALRLIGRVNALVESTPRVNVSVVADVPVCQYAVEWSGARVVDFLIREHGVPATPSDVRRIEELLGNGSIGFVAVVSPAKTPASRKLVELARGYGVPVLYVPSPMSPTPVIDKIENVSIQLRRISSIIGVKRGVGVGVFANFLAIVLGVVLVVAGIVLLLVKRGLGLSVLLFAMSVASFSALYVNPVWVIVMASAALAYGSLSPVIASRRLFFLASASPHAALLAATLSIPLAYVTGFGGEYLWAIVIGLGLVYFVGYLIYRGVDADIATALFVAFTSSASVLALYYVLTSFPVETSVWAIIIGDPLLTSVGDAVYALAIASISVLVLTLTCREQICIGIDRVYVELAGVNVKLYDVLVYTVLALTTVALIKIVGFVLEHILVLLPAAIATSVSRSARSAMVLSMNVSLIAGLLGLYLSVALGLAPAGVTGMVLLFSYIVALIIGKRR